MKAVVGLWGGVRAAEVGAERAGREGPGVQEQAGQGLDAHLVVSRSRRRRCEEKCVRERGTGPAFMLVVEGRDSLVPWPWGILQAAVLGLPSLLNHELESVFLPTIQQCHVLLLKPCPSDLGGSF